jgi:hypothetical protein
MQNIFGSNILNEKCVLISSEKLSQIFSRYKKCSEIWYCKCKVVWCKALAIVIRLQWNINFQVRFSKTSEIFRYTLFIVEEQTERVMGMVSLTVAFRNFGPPLKRDTDIQMEWEISGIHRGTIPDITSLSVRSKQVYKPSIDWHKTLSIREVPSSYMALKVSHSEFHWGIDW